MNPSPTVTRDRGGVMRGRVRATSSWAVLGFLIASAATPAAAQTAGSGAAQVDELVVTGTRASLQSAIERKRIAPTNVDSIVAEDVAQFPDKNIGEALSRVTGVQLTRDFGEGTQVSIRGVEPDLNRVEINGLSLLNSQGTGARGASFQELASELVASIDVFKGYTADMTEGGVGGTVSITTRKPLDLTKPLFAVTASGQYLDIDESTKFRGNVTAGRKFLDDRLGVIVNATFDDNSRSADFIRNTEWNRFATSATTSGDFDNSPEKTFVHPDYVSVGSKAACPTGTSTEALTCLRQWDDNLPRIPRYSMWQRSTERVSVTGTVQYEINENLTAFVEYTGNRQDELLTDFNYVVDLSSQHRLNAITYDRNGNPITSVSPGLVSTRTATVDDNHNVVDIWTASRAGTGSAATANTLGANATTGSANNFNVQTREFDASYKSDYASGGFRWRSENLTVDGLFGRVKTRQRNNTNSVQFNASIPDIRVTLADDGAPSFTFPAGYDPNDPATYARYANNGAGVDFTTTAAAFQYRPLATDGQEDTLKLDVDYLVDMPFFTKFEAGYQYRNTEQLQYGNGGYTIRTIDPVTGRPVNPIVVQSAALNHNITIDPRRTSDGPTTANYLSNPATLTSPFARATLLGFVNAHNQQTRNNFFSGSQYDPPPGAPSGWLTPNAISALAAGLTDLSLYDHDLIRSAPGRNSAGAIVGEYDQIPAFHIDEQVNAAYAQTHFATELLGMPLSGNVGVRFVETRGSATGSYTERQIVPNPAGGANITEDVSTTIVTVKNKYRDWLPTLNLQLDITDKLIARVNASRVMARPKFVDLRPNATCTFDRTPGGSTDADLDDCTAGNPDLKPYRANQYDVTVGYYADADTLLNASFFYKDVETFIVSSTLRRGVDLFNNGNLFDVTQPINGEGAQIYGLELSAQTAFTFLPAPWDGFGALVNYTFSKAENVGLINQLSFDELPFPGLSKHSYNIVVYYDKGPINARVAYNGRTDYLQSAADRSGNPVFREGTGYLDARVSYAFGNNFTVFAEGKNLTGEVESFGAGDIRLSEVQWSGRRYFIGFSYRY